MSLPLEGAPLGDGHDYGHDYEEYVREAGDWRIARLRLERLRIDPLT